MKLFTLPTELHTEILQYLHWSEHFAAAAACPIWASILQSENFRRQRYYGDFWIEKRPFTNTLSGSSRDDRIPSIPQYPQDSREEEEVKDGQQLLSQLGWHRGIGLHKLLGSRTAVLDVKRSGQSRLLISRVSGGAGVAGSLKDGDGLNPLRSAFEHLWGKFEYYDATDSPILEDDPQFFPDDEERAGLEAKVEASGNADGEINLGHAYYYTDGDNVSEIFKHKSVYRRWIYLHNGRSEQQASLKQMLEKLGSAITEEVFRKDDKALECWAVFERYTEFTYHPSYDTKTHPRRKIFMYFLILKETEDLPECECLVYALRPCPRCLMIPEKFRLYWDH